MAEVAYWKYVQGNRGLVRYRIDALCLKVVFNRTFMEKGDIVEPFGASPLWTSSPIRL
jgi:hypothetical protein